MSNGNGANSECCIHVSKCLLNVMSEMSTCKEINLNGGAYINYIGKLASILLTELCPPKFICWSPNSQCGRIEIWNFGDKIRFL